MRAFTLIELLVVLIIVGILAGLSIPNYTRTRERAMDREAQTALSLIQAAERMYRVRNPTFYASAVLNDININLQLSLASGEGGWVYSITIAGPPPTFIAQGARDPQGTAWDRTWQIDQDDTESSCSGNGCP